MPDVKLIGIDDDWKTDTLIGVLIGFGFLLSMTSTGMSIGTPIKTLSALGQAISFTAGWVVVGVLAPGFEEPLFRGVIMGYLREKTNDVYAIIITAVVFSFFHFAVYGEALQAAFVGAFTFSIIASVLTIKTDSILPATIMHAIVNSYLYFQAYQFYSIGAS